MKTHQSRSEWYPPDVEYYESHREQLMAEYADQWIAICNKQVVGAASDPFALIAQLKARGVPRNRILFRHMTEETEILALHIL